MFYSYKNCPVIISGVNIFASNVSIEIQSSNDSNYLVDRRFSYDYHATDNVVSTISVSYYLTGKDELKTFINNERIALPGNIGGLVFSSGYLSSYSINAAPNQPASAEIQIVVFDKIYGSFTPSTEVPKDTPVLNFSDVSIDGSGVGNEDNIISVSYSFRNDVKPYYSISTGEGLEVIIPERIVFGKKTITTKIELDNLSGDLSILGRKAELTLNLRDRAAGQIKEAYIARGIIEGRNIVIEEESFIRGTLMIKQEAPGEIPLIFGHIPLSGVPGDVIRVSGSGFNVFPEVLINSQNIGIVNYISDELLEFVITNEVGTGPISLYVGGNLITDPDALIVNSSEILVTGFFPLSGKIGSTVSIQGFGFDFADAVFIGDALVQEFLFSSPKLGEIKVPQAAQLGFIKVKSDANGTSGSSSLRFIPFPEIKKITPSTAIGGDIVQISGLALSGITGVYFNNKIATIQSITDVRVIPVALPTGDTTGPIIIIGEGGVSGVFSGFITRADISGFTPLSGAPGDFVTISGENFYDSNLKRSATGVADSLYNKFLVDFGGGSTGFNIVNSQTLTGLVPTLGRTGILKLLRPDGLSHDATGIFTVYKGPPVILGTIPSTGLPAVRGNRGDFIFVTGLNFSETTGLYLIPSGGSPTVNLLNPPIVYFNEISDELIQFSIPSGVTGLNSIKMQTTTPGAGTGSGILFVKSPPSILGFTPINGSLNEPFVVSGDQFYSDTTRLLFSGNVVSGKEFQAQILQMNINTVSGFIPGLSSAINYRIVIDNGMEYAVSDQTFKYIGAPTISGFTPVSGGTGTYVIISGDNLKNLTVSHGELAIEDVDVLSGADQLPTGILIRIPHLTGYLSLDSLMRNNEGPFILGNTFGSVTSTGNFITVPPAMIISGFSPSVQGRTETVSITGLNIFQTTGVGFSGQNGLSVVPTVGNAFFAKFFPTIGYPKTRLQVRIPSNALSGPMLLMGAYHTGITESVSVLSYASIESIHPNKQIYNHSIRLSGEDIHNSRFWFKGVTTGAIDNSNPLVLDTTGLAAAQSRPFEENSIVLNGVLSRSNLISGLSTTYSIVGAEKIADVLVPHPLEKFPVIYAASKELEAPSGLQLRGASVQFFPLPSISGISHTEIRVGQTLFVSGLNANNLNINCLGITGNNLAGSGRVEFVSKFNTSIKEIDGDEMSFFELGEFFIPPEPPPDQSLLEQLQYNYPIYKNIIGSGVTNSSTGVYVIPLQVGPNFIGTGKVFLFFDEESIYPETESSRVIDSSGAPPRGESLSEGFAGKTLLTQYEITGTTWSNAFKASQTASRLNDILFTGWNLVILPELLEVSGFIPTSGYYNQTVQIIGTGLGNVTGLSLVDDSNNYYPITIQSVLSEKIAFKIPIVPVDSGRINIFSTHSSGTTSQYFTIIKPPIITGFIPTEGVEGSEISLFGINLQDVASIKLKSKNNNTLYSFTAFATSGVDDQGNAVITGLIPSSGIQPLPQKFDIRIDSADPIQGGSETGVFTIQVEDLTVFGNLRVFKNTFLKSGLHVSGASLLNTLVATGAGNALIVSGNSLLNTLDVIGTLNVDGAVDMDSVLDVQGAVTLRSSLSVAGQADIVGALNVDGAVDMDSVLDVQGAVTLQSSLSVTGQADIVGALNVDGAVDMDSVLDVQGAVTLQSSLSVSGASLLNTLVATGAGNALIVSGHSSLNTLSLTGSVNINGTGSLFINGVEVNAGDAINKDRITGGLVIVTGNGGLTVSGHSSLNTLSLTGSVNINGTGSLFINGVEVNAGGAVTNITNSTDFSVFSTGVQSTVNIYSGSGNFNIYNSGNGSIVFNSGTSRFDFFSGDATFINSNIGSLVLSSPTNINSGTNTISGGTINITGGTNAITNNFYPTGTGNIFVTGDVVNIYSGNVAISGGVNSITGGISNLFGDTTVNINFGTNTITASGLGGVNITLGTNTFAYNTGNVSIISGTNTLNNSGSLVFITGSANITGGTNAITGNASITGGVNTIAGENGTFFVTGGTNTIQSSVSVTITGGTNTINNSGGSVYVTGDVKIISGTSFVTGNASITGGVNTINAGAISVTGGVNNIETTSAHITSGTNNIQVFNGLVSLTGNASVFNSEVSINGIANINNGTNFITGNASITGGVNTITGENGTFFVTGGTNTIQSSVSATITGGTNTINNNGGSAYVTGDVKIISGTSFVTGNASITGGVNTITGSNGAFYITGGTNTIQSSVSATITGGTNTINNNGGYVYLTGSANITGGVNSVTGANGTFNITGGTNTVENYNGIVYATGTISTIHNSGGSVYLTGSANITGGTNSITGNNNANTINGGINQVLGTTINVRDSVNSITGTTVSLVQSTNDVFGSANITQGENTIFGTAAIIDGINSIIIGVTGDTAITGRLGVTGRIDLSGIFQYRYTGAIPTSNADTVGQSGQFAVDNNFLYYKGNGWKRIAWTTTWP